jgi:hypothetical protein|tara:strand:+ start:381 stop:560 length:180 start_codon:yes stop_codon:yes gene_type:complete
MYLDFIILQIKTYKKKGSLKKLNFDLAAHQFCLTNTFRKTVECTDHKNMRDLMVLEPWV